jgi:hypothetical protein
MKLRIRSSSVVKKCRFNLGSLRDSLDRYKDEIQSKQAGPAMTSSKCQSLNTVCIKAFYFFFVLLFFLHSNERMIEPFFSGTSCCGSQQRASNAYADSLSFNFQPS